MLALAESSAWLLTKGLIRVRGLRTRQQGVPGREAGAPPSSSPFSRSYLPHYCTPPSVEVGSLSQALLSLLRLGREGRNPGAVGLSHSCAGQVCVHPGRLHLSMVVGLAAPPLQISFVFEIILAGFTFAFSLESVLPSSNPLMFKLFMVKGRIPCTLDPTLSARPAELSAGNVESREPAWKWGRAHVGRAENPGPWVCCKVKGQTRSDGLGASRADG